MYINNINIYLMCDIISKLPENIKLHILSYTYLPQPKSLLLDIKSYLSTHSMIHKYYYYEIRAWPINSDEESKLNWLFYNLLLHSNNNIPVRNGYVDYFYFILYRHYMLQNKSRQDVDIVVSRMNNKNITTRINILWGLYKPLERIQFITNICNKQF